MNIYDLIKNELAVGVDRPTDSDIVEKYDSYSEDVVVKALNYAHGVIEEPAVTELVPFEGNLIFAPDNDQDWEDFNNTTGGYYRSYYIDDDLVDDLGLEIEDAMNILERYLDSKEKIIAPTFVCGGL